MHPAPSPESRCEPAASLHPRKQRSQGSTILRAPLARAPDGSSANRADGADRVTHGLDKPTNRGGSIVLPLSAERARRSLENLGADKSGLFAEERFLSALAGFHLLARPAEDRPTPGPRQPRIFLAAVFGATSWPLRVECLRERPGARHDRCQRAARVASEDRWPGRRGSSAANRNTRRGGKSSAKDVASEATNDRPKIMPSPSLRKADGAKPAQWQSVPENNQVRVARIGKP